MMPPDTLDRLRRVNEYLGFALLRLRPERRHCSAIDPSEFSDLLSQVRQGAECLRRESGRESGHKSAPPGSAQSGSRAPLEREAVNFRANLETLKQLLPDVHVRLLAEKLRLERAQIDLAAAEKWAEARRRGW